MVMRFRQLQQPTLTASLYSPHEPSLHHILVVRWPVDANKHIFSASRPFQRAPCCSPLYIQLHSRDQVLQLQG